jgi:hypothetical protein
MKAILVAAAMSTPIMCSASDFSRAASHLTGFTIVAVKTIDSFKDRGKDKQDGFEGCDYDRTIIFDDDKYVVCQGYGYHYAYRPEATLLVKQSGGTTIWKMVVEDEVFDVSTR